MIILREILGVDYGKINENLIRMGVMLVNLS